MPLFNVWGNYTKPGPGVEKDEAPKPAPIRFFVLYFRKFSKLTQLNLIFLIPTAVVVALMIALHFLPTHVVMNIGYAGGVREIDVWNLYVVPLPLILLSPFAAGLTIVTRNFAREEHAFVWSDFWEAVAKNWKYFLLNGVVIYLAYFVLSFALIYYYNRAADNGMLMVPFWFCMILSILFIFAQYYIPVMFVTFDLTFRQVYRNAMVFVFAGLGRNFLLTIILGGLLFVITSVIPIIPITATLLLAFAVFVFFSFTAFLINFTIYPVIDQYLIQPQQNGKREEKERDPALEENDGEPETDEDDYVFIQGKLVKRSEQKPGADDETSE